MHALNFGTPLEMFSCFVLGECAMSWLQASKLREERERASKTRSSGMAS